ncbi:MAG TPA: hypothetical protein VF756_24715 [Thermoanaerobaculia bacterium]
MNMKRFLIGLLLVSLMVQGAVAKTVDPAAAPDQLLDSLTQGLDSRGIDVRRGEAQSKSYRAERPQLTKLANFPQLAVPPEAGRFPSHFEAGAFTEAYLVAVDAGTPRSPRRISSEESFRKIWNSAPKEKRVFLSFARADLSHAESVRSALEARGYVTFLYIDGSTQYPKTNSVQAGTYFKQAGHHLVIDSGNARRSAGVITEAKVYRGLARGGGRKQPAVVTSTTIKPPPPPPRPEPSAPCCKLCRYVNGVLVGCGPVECGPQCHAAHPPF